MNLSDYLNNKTTEIPTFSIYEPVVTPDIDQLENTKAEIPTLENYLSNVNNFKKISTNTKPKDNSNFNLDNYVFNYIPKTVMTTFNNKKGFIDTMTSVYSKILANNNIDQKYVPWLVAQDALESRWGQSLSGKNNLGGIKGKGTVRKTKEEINGRLIDTTQEFRDFNNLEDYANYKVSLLNGKRYRAFNGNFANAVAKGGYATDSNYENILNSVYKQIV